MEMILYLVVSIIAAFVLIFLAKVVLQKLIRRPVDYYEKEEIRQDDLIMKEIREKNREGEI